jgi:hypothetical protein
VGLINASTNCSLLYLLSWSSFLKRNFPFDITKKFSSYLGRKVARIA